MQNPMIKYGVYLGAVLILFSSILAVTNPKMLFSGPLTSVITLLTSIFAMVLASREKKALQEGFLSFGEAFTTTFGTQAIGSLLAAIGIFILGLIIPDLVEAKRAVLEEAGTMMSDFFGSNSDFAEAMEDQLELQIENTNLGLLSQLGEWLVSLIFTAILALIVSAFVKKSH